MGVEGSKPRSEQGKRMNEISWCTCQTRKEIHSYSLTAIRLLLWWTKNIAFSHIHISSKKEIKRSIRMIYTVPENWESLRQDVIFQQLHPHKEIVRKLVFLKHREKVFAEVPEFSIEVLTTRRKKWKEQLIEGIKETSRDRGYKSASFPWVVPWITRGLSQQAPFYLAKWCYNSGSPDSKKSWNSKVRPCCWNQGSRGTTY